MRKLISVMIVMALVVLAGCTRYENKVEITTFKAVNGYTAHLFNVDSWKEFTAFGTNKEAAIDTAVSAYLQSITAHK